MAFHQQVGKVNIANLIAYLVHITWLAVRVCLCNNICVIAAAFKLIIKRNDFSNN